jgi:hypothetical protein
MQNRHHDKNLICHCTIKRTKNVVFCDMMVWEPPMGTSHRLPKAVSKQQLDNKITTVTNYRTNTANAPWYISNITLHNDLRIPYVTEVIRTYAKNHKNRTAQNDNQLLRDLFTQPEIGRRLNRMWPEDLIR